MVHADTDGDCIMDEGEQPLAGVTIELLDAQNNVVATTTTDMHGKYAFENLAPGKYSVREKQPPGYLDGGDSVGTVGGRIIENDWIGDIVLTGGTHGEEYNFCEIPPASISGMVHADLDGDCLYDEGEPMLAGVKITLTNLDTGETWSTLTDHMGAYSFENLAPGRYEVHETQPDGYFDSMERVGSAGGVIRVNDTITEIAIGAGVQAVDYDFCEALPSRIEGMVHIDLDGDCIMDEGEQPLPDVVIELLDAQGNILATTKTDEHGKYSFENLAPGTYGVRERQPIGYFDGGENVGTAGGQITANDQITGITLISATEGLRYDFCELLPNSLSGMVHVDLDGDCIMDEGEMPLQGVKIELLDEAGNVLRTTFTDMHGEYLFDNLPSGTYSIRETQPAWYLDGGDSVGSMGGELAGNDLIKGIVLISGNNGENYNFCEVPPASLSGMVHVDLDGDCVFDPEEQPLAGVTIELLDSAGRVVRTTVTNMHGEYRFDNLTPGEYGVREIQPAGYLDSGDSVGTAGGVLAANDLITQIHLGAGVNGEQYNFCEQYAGKISGYVFQDGPNVLAIPGQETDVLAGKDGKRTPDDTPIPGVRLRLADAQGNPILDANGQPRVAYTDAAGYYEFADLPPGQYTVYQEQPEEYLDAIDTPGSTGGQAANVGGPALVVELMQPHFNDVIVGIPLAGGIDSLENNFSEVRTEFAFFPPQVEAPPVAAAAAILYPAPPAYILPQQPLVSPELPPIYGGSGAVIGYTWHLSVVDAGRPRGADAGPRVARSLVRSVSVSGWDDSNLAQSQWQHDPNAAKQRRMFGMRGATPIVGDFNGDGLSEMGVFYKGEWYIDLNGNGVWDEDDLWAKLGHQDDKPVVGDWNGDGKTDIGIFGPAWPRDPMAVAKEPGLPDPLNPEKPEAKNLPPKPERAAAGVRELRRTARGEKREDLIDHVFFYGAPLDIPLVGDWNGDGIDTVAVFNGGQWYLDVDGDGKWSEGDLAFTYGQKGDTPVVGDWDGNGVDEVGVFRNGTWILDTNRNRRIDPEDRTFQLGASGDVPVVGDWDGDGVDEPGVYTDGEQLATRPTSNAATK
jgi:protocatechuate 3,4-dioxygenase beta subunit